MITIEQAREQYAGAEAVHDFDHVLRVLALAERLARAEGADLEVVRAAALLHDAARGKGAGRIPLPAGRTPLPAGRTPLPAGRTPLPAGRDHAAAGAEIARHLLAGHPPDRVEAVAHAIAAHRFRGGPEPQTIEARVLHDADKLDAIGAVGIGRAFHYGGQHGQRLWGEVASDYEETPDSRAEHTPVHEYVFKLARIKDRLLTDSGRQLAAERHTFMVSFFEQLEREVRGLA
ncbi:MAG: HD domain-containing protein [Anaerolineae bacterium]|nr:HD domain-containing protein [Anaerolineae bacterium]